MHILITGGTGFIGSALIPALREQGHEVSVLSRSRNGDIDGVAYRSQLQEIDDSVDTVINLAGASLAGKRWSEAYKREIVSSRLDTTAQLGRWMLAMEEPPGLLISASAIGFYGPRDDEVLTEESNSGEGFAAQLCGDWEAAATAAVADLSPVPRLCLVRLGVVLDASDGAYPQMAQPFRFGLANWIGSGRQWLSWVHRTDVVAAFLRLIDDDKLDGVFNITAPEAATSRQFCDAMRQHYRTLLAMPMPAPVLRLMVGEMADELLITGQRVSPARLLASGFNFQYSSLDSALAEIRNSERSA